MKISEICKSYFSGFQEVSDYKKNSNKKNTLAVLKILSYFTGVIPLGFAAMYGAASLYGRVSKKTHLSSSDETISKQAQQNNVISSLPRNSKIDFSNLPHVTLLGVIKTYKPEFTPQVNGDNLLQYSQTEDYKRHAKTARIYYNSNQLAKEDALRIIFQREPTNIAMGYNQYNENNLKKLFDYSKGVFNEVDSKKADGSPFKALPNTASVYSETYLWDPPGGKNTKEIACLSLPAPALDSTNQPHYQYYMKEGKLDAEKYEQEMGFLFKVIEQAVKDNKETAFGNQGIKRLILSRFGQGAFLGDLSPNDQKTAQTAYKNQLAHFLDRMKDVEVEVVMSEYTKPAEIWHDKMIIGDIIKTAKQGDLIINAWDPHSAPGNGNDADQSFDGAMGKGSGIMLTQTSWLNETLRSENSLIAVE